MVGSLGAGGDKGETELRLPPRLGRCCVTLVFLSCGSFVTFVLSFDLSLSLFCPCLCFVSSLSSSCLVFVLVLALTCLCHLYLVFVLSLLCLVFVFVLVFVFTSPYSSSSLASFSDFAFALLCCSSCFSCAVDLQPVVNRQL